MGKIQRQIELSNEAVSLIKEFRKLNEIIGENPFKNVEINKDINKIIIDDLYKGKLEYRLDNISYVFEDEIDEITSCGSRFYEGFDLAINELGYKYKNRDKEEFMNYVGKLYYMKFRCEEIYERLQQIEKEYIKINKLS